MKQLVLIRHGASQWNLENRFTGWVDVLLSPRGEEEAREAGKKLQAFRFNQAFTSVLTRAIKTLEIVLEEIGQSDLAFKKNQALNERMYGDLQGLNKAETIEKHGAEQVKLWRRSFDVRPPGGESLKDTAARVIPYYQEKILPLFSSGESILVVAHGNSLRALVMYLNQLAKEEVLELNIPTGTPLLFELSDSGKVLSHRYL
ncbi:MAG: 2,3-bisphosphoglycerate-dependent phosphoglycerate mutase [Nitrospirota bacterium]|nr:2,3-bisphosphoglycerate-dependent phosphoglycerate mutase [Nitrospirota bacterium]